MLEEQIVGAVVVEHAHAADVSTSSDHHVRGRQTVMPDVGELTLRLQRRRFDLLSTSARGSLDRSAIIVPRS